MLAEYRQLFEALEKHQISYCLLRDDLSGGNEPADIDILIREQDWDRANPLLQALGYRLWRTSRLNPGRLTLIKYASGKLIALDIHKKIVHAGLVYLDEEVVLSRRRKTGNYYLPGKTDLLPILLFHNLLGKKQIQDKHFGQIKELAGQVDRAEAEAAQKPFGTERIFRAILDRLDEVKADPCLLLKMRRSLIASIYRKKPLLAWAVNWLRFKKFLFAADPRRRGMLMSFVGVDGAGKSTLTEAVRDALDGLGRCRTSVVYMGPWGHYRLKSLNRLGYAPDGVMTFGGFIKKLRQRNRAAATSFADVLRVSYRMARGKTLTKEEEAIHGAIRENSRLYLFLRYVRSAADVNVFFVLLAVEMYLRYFGIYRRLRRGEIVITDRYIYDLMVGSMHEVASTHRRIRSFLCAVFFRPDKAFLLRNSPEQILARKNQLDAANLEAIQSVYDGLASKYHFLNVVTSEEAHVLAQRLVETNFGEMVDALRF